MALPSALRLLILSTLAFNWYGACGAAVVVGRAVEDVEYAKRTSFSRLWVSFVSGASSKTNESWWGMKYSCGAK